MPSYINGKNFNPYVSYVVSASSTGVDQLVTQPAILNSESYAKDIMISNAATTTAHISWGTSNQSSLVSTTTSPAVLPGAVVIFDTASAPTHIGVKLEGSGTGNVYLSLGSGS